MTTPKPSEKYIDLTKAERAWAEAFDRATAWYRANRKADARPFRSLPNRPEVSIPGPSPIPQHGST